MEVNPQICFIGIVQQCRRRVAGERGASKWGRLALIFPYHLSSCWRLAFQWVEVVCSRALASTHLCTALRVHAIKWRRCNDTDGIFGLLRLNIFKFGFHFMNMRTQIDYVFITKRNITARHVELISYMQYTHYTISVCWPVVDAVSIVYLCLSFLGRLSSTPHAVISEISQQWATKLHGPLCYCICPVATVEVNMKFVTPFLTQSSLFPQTERIVCVFCFFLCQIEIDQVVFLSCDN